MRLEGETALVTGATESVPVQDPVRVREVGPRDGFQNEPEVIETLLPSPRLSRTWLPSGHRVSLLSASRLWRGVARRTGRQTFTRAPAPSIGFGDLNAVWIP